MIFSCIDKLKLLVGALKPLANACLQFKKYKSLSILRTNSILDEQLLNFGCLNSYSKNSNGSASDADNV